MKDSAEMYKAYESKMQRSGLFKLIAENFSIQKALYPGSYIHISPSFFFPEVVYVDTDKKAIKFFKDTTYLNVINKTKTYLEEPIIRFHPLNYQKSIPEEYPSFDLMISQYAGFISHYCKKFLKKDGILVANNSHGDAGVAFTDEDYRLIGIVNFRNKKFTYSIKNLDSYFVPKKAGNSHTKKYLMSLTRGIGYKKTASHYIFKKN
jgi:hypothetical protein